MAVLQGRGGELLPTLVTIRKCSIHQFAMGLIVVRVPFSQMFDSTSNSDGACLCMHVLTCVQKNKWKGNRSSRLPALHYCVILFISSRCLCCAFKKKYCYDCWKFRFPARLLGSYNMIRLMSRWCFRLSEAEGKQLLEISHFITAESPS